MTLPQNLHWLLAILTLAAYNCCMKFCISSIYQFLILTSYGVSTTFQKKAILRRHIICHCRVLVSYVCICNELFFTSDSPILLGIKTLLKCSLTMKLMQNPHNIIFNDLPASLEKCNGNAIGT